MDISRRAFVRSAALASLAIQKVGWADDVAVPSEAAAPTTSPAGDGALHWLQKEPPAACTGVTWGMPWARGRFKKEQTFNLVGDQNALIPVQTWPLAYWPDGTLKWTAHAATGEVAKHVSLKIAPGKPAVAATQLQIKETPDAIEIDTGVIRCRLKRSGSNLIEQIERDSKRIAGDVSLICLRQDAPSQDLSAQVNLEQFTGQIDSMVLEQSGPIRSVIKIDGKHVGPNQRKLLPFTVRLYFYAGGDSVRMMHTFIFDGDANHDFIRGLGVQCSVPMHDLPHDRHIRFAGENGGLWAESVRNLSGLRRDSGRDVIAKQLAGQACPPVSSFPSAVRDRLDLIPAWDGFSLYQSSADAFTIRKRTGGENVSWITSAHGGRAPGFGYVGGVSGGAAFGLRDFWQRHPTQLDITGAATDQARVTIWMYSPSAPAMDLRFYHDDMGMKTHAQQLEGLEITYEDYEPGFGTPVGIARSSELTLWALPATPSRERLVEMSKAVATPAMLVCAPEQYHSCNLFGGIWSLPDRSTPQRAKIEDTLDWYVEYYRGQVEQRRWYGFWDYGDIMHTYDVDRHCWRYDVGGFAWDNSELSPDLWLWYSFLRTGDANTFRFAEAMTRHTGEVDAYHLGPYALLGTRHGVMHWGDSAKQLRISTAAYRRFYYFLTADERVGDIMRALVDADQTFATTDPIRKIRVGEYHPEPHALAVGMGTDWGSLAAAWLAEWERTGSEKCKMKLVNGMKSLAAMPHGLFTGGGSYDPDTGLFKNMHGDEVSVSHLSAVFGLPEICAELISLLDVPEFEKAWLQYCEYYNANQRDRQAALGFDSKTQPLTMPHSRLTAYSAWKKKDPALATRAWQEFFGDDAKSAPRRYQHQATKVAGNAVLRPIEEASWVSTNDTAQWALAAIENLALIGEAIPKD